ncbi:YceI family protein [Arenimonas sp. MALMAid1274]|uniref:YceI family protein n=1 Tax=Arenimonas sp. MALMAid1274 TaxID=3411630 RepID=UPI003BA3040E
MRFAATLALLLASASVSAADYTAREGSTLGFSGAYQGEAFTGRFEKFTPSIRFDPADLAGSRFDVRIDLASARTSNADYDPELAGASFFDTGRTPEARYIATRFRALGGNRYVAEGSLTLRGASHPVPLTFTWTPGASPVLAGEATVRRLQFKVGTGEWADVELIPDAIKVSTRLVLAPAPAAPAKAG